MAEMMLQSKEKCTAAFAGVFISWGELHWSVGAEHKGQSWSNPQRLWMRDRTELCNLN